MTGNGLTDIIAAHHPSLVAHRSSPIKDMSKSEKKPVDLPRALVELFEGRKEAEMEIARAVVVGLVRRGKISPHQGAEILGMRCEDFLPMAAGEEVPTVDYQ